MDYKQTLNLPKTEFPMQGKLPEREPATLLRWQEHDLYGALQKRVPKVRRSSCMMVHPTPTAIFISAMRSIKCSRTLSTRAS